MFDVWLCRGFCTGKKKKTLEKMFFFYLAFVRRYKTIVYFDRHCLFLSAFGVFLQIYSYKMKSAECSNDSICPKSQLKSGRRSSLTTVVRRSNPNRQNLSSIGKTWI